MYSTDPMIEIAVDRQAERVRKVQAVGGAGRVMPTASVKFLNSGESHTAAQPAKGFWFALATLVPVMLGLVWMLVG